MSYDQMQTQVILSGSIQPEHISQQLKIQPDGIWKPGDPNPPLTPHEDFGWFISSGLEQLSSYKDSNPNLGNQILKTLDRLTYRIGILKQWAANNRQKLDLSLQCHISSQDALPQIFLNKDLLRRIASLEMSIDIDIIKC